MGFQHFLFYGHCKLATDHYNLTLKRSVFSTFQQLVTKLKHSRHRTKYILEKYYNHLALSQSFKLWRNIFIINKKRQIEKQIWRGTKLSYFLKKWRLQFIW